MKKYRSAEINVVANGFIIRIGCQTIIAESPKKLKKLICDYLDDPEKAEKELFENSIVFGGWSPQQTVPCGSPPEPGWSAGTASQAPVAGIRIETGSDSAAAVTAPGFLETGFDPRAER